MSNSTGSFSDRSTKRALDEQSWRLRRPLPDVEPRVEPPRPQQRRITMKRQSVKADYDPLDALGLKAARTKEQIDALEKMLHSAMPPRVVLDNTFVGLRNSIADELETAMEVMWKRGVAHAESIANTRIHELEARLAQNVDWLQERHEELLTRNSPTVEPLIWQSDEPDLATDLAKFLDELPDTQPGTPEWVDKDSPCTVLDLDALTREINSISQIVAC